ncbi:hypothetical protein EPA93_25450 [Ktedonosporobacter rubrisoli]|uniref:ABM domain-containing protein n=1 Tax=Ktedonosporobacter rubrisoli TaxID=2509675 RepID=A0A4P6JUX1_KTERU|nr:antibiotic biosynthesis monooxygenase family protein [Ktedonosporobacter rubrisoli]QBD79143.1 hypothetical protein EPA93_25450 [Ktedonosporobacter rubrisoli]
MYGTVAQMRARAGTAQQLIDQLKDFEAAQVPGTVAVYCYRMDSDENEYYIAVVFESKEAYRANAESPEQDARYRQLCALLEEEPVWHDGEIISSLQKASVPVPSGE